MISAPVAQTAPAAEVAPGELLVQFDPLSDDNVRRGARSMAGAALIRRLPSLSIEHLRLPANANLVAVERGLRRLQGIRSVQRNYRRHIAEVGPPNDPLWLDGALWGPRKINAPAAWSTFGPGTHRVVIVSIDTGVDYTHPDLAPNMWRNPDEIAANGVDDDGNGYIDDVYGIDLVNRDQDPMDDHGHGTHTMGTAAAAANNGIGIAGIAWNAQIAACKFLDRSGFGFDSDAAGCFDYVLRLKARGVNVRVTNNSWGRERIGEPAAVLLNAMNAAGQAGVLNVVAAGNANNNNDATPFDPGSFDLPSIITVAASNETDERWPLSNYGATSVDLAAPGSAIVSTERTAGSDYAPRHGTSMSVAHVTGTAALLFAHAPSLTVANAKDAILRSVDPVPAWSGMVATGGRLNVYQAMVAIGFVAPAPSSSTPFAATVPRLPGLLEAEQFDNGGEGIAYHDDSPGNSGGAYRQTDVDLEPTASPVGGVNVGWMAAGEWLLYSLEVTSPGSHRLEFRVASLGQGGTFHVEAGGTNISGSVVIPDTGGWQNWVTVSRIVTLAGGPQQWRLVMDANGPAGAVGNIDSMRSVLASTTSPAFRGVPIRLPGTIESEEFDLGPAGGTYFDTTSGNSGGAFRATDVDIEPTTDSSGGHNVGWIEHGEWLDYTVSVDASASYTLEARVAASGVGGSFRVEVNGQDITGPISIPDTGGWQTWTTVRRTGIFLRAGMQTWRVVFSAQSAAGIVGNVNYLRVAPDPSTGAAPFPGTAVALPGLIEAENFDTGNPGVAYLDSTAGNSGGAYRMTDVDLEAAGDLGGGFNVGWLVAVEWLQYSVTLSTAGIYSLDARVASQGRGGSFHIEVNGTAVTGAITVPDTGGWQSWTTVTVPGVSLPAGSQVWRVVMDSNGPSGGVGNLNYLRVR